MDEPGNGHRPLTHNTHSIEINEKSYLLNGIGVGDHSGLLLLEADDGERMTARVESILVELLVATKPGALARSRMKKLAAALNRDDLCVRPGWPDDWKD